MIIARSVIVNRSYYREIIGKLDKSKYGRKNAFKLYGHLVITVISFVASREGKVPFSVSSQVRGIALGKMSTGKMVPPNGGWGWMVVIGAAMINVSVLFIFLNVIHLA